MENKTWIGIGIVALISILAGAGYLITDKTYYCSDKGIVMDCQRFSSTGIRCYPSLTTNTGYKDCSNWTKVQNEDINNILNQSENLINNSVIENIPISITTSGSYLCPPRSENKPCEAIR